MRRNVNVRALQEQMLVSNALDAGMITTADPADIPEGALQLGQNVICRYGKTSRRAGCSVLTPAKPDSNAVLKINYIKKRDGSSYTVRITNASVYSKGVGVWNAITGTLTGTSSDRIQSAVVLNDFIFANNGADYVQKVDFAGGTFARLGNCDKYRFITGFANRVVAAALASSNEVLIAWSGNGNISEWNSAVDETAGSTPLVDSPSDLSDFIKGVFAMNDQLVIPREHSMWVAYKQPIPTNPFYFKNVLPGIGTDAPFSCVVTGSGFAWVDVRSKGVFILDPASGQYQRISQPVEDYLFSNVNDSNSIFSSYSRIANELYVCIPQAGSTYVLVGTFNFTSKTWVVGLYNNITSIDNTELSDGTLSIDQLTGTIDDLVGTIDSLGTTQTYKERKLFGLSTGDIYYEDESLDTDNGSAFTTSIISKEFTINTYDEYISSIRIDYVAKIGGTINLYYRRDGGDWTLAKSVTVTELNKAKLIRFQKNIHCRRLAWKIEATDGAFDLTHYELRVYPSGASSK